MERNLPFNASPMEIEVVVAAPTVRGNLERTLERTCAFL